MRASLIAIVSIGISHVKGFHKGGKIGNLRLVKLGHRDFATLTTLA